MFRGFVTALRQSWSGDDRQTCTVDAIDLFSAMAQRRADDQPGNVSVTDRIFQVVAEADVVGLYALGASSTIVGPVEAGSALAIAQAAAASEQGRLFVSAAGFVTYEPPTVDMDAAPVAAFTDDGAAAGIRYGGLSFELSDRWIINSCTVTGSNGSTGTYIDGLSNVANGPAARSITTQLQTDAQCRALAQTVVERYKWPKTRPSGWVCTPTHDLELLDVVNIELGKVVTLRRLPKVGAAYTALLQIASISVDVNRSGATFSFSGAPVDTTPRFRWGVSLWGGVDGWR